MNWIKLTIETNEQTGDLISSVLVDAGASGVQIEGGSIPDAKGDEYGENKDNNSDFSVSAYLQRNRIFRYIELYKE